MEDNNRDLVDWLRVVGDGGGQKSEYLNKAADEIELLRAEIERLGLLVDGKFKEAIDAARLLRAGPGRKAFEFDIQCSIIPLIAEHLAADFKAQGGENYVSMEFNHDELGPMELIMQRRWGETPAARATRFAKALEFYANPQSWQTTGHAQIDADLAPIRQDAGKTAQDALKKETTDG